MAHEIGNEQYLSSFKYQYTASHTTSSIPALPVKL